MNSQKELVLQLQMATSELAGLQKIVEDYNPWGGYDVTDMAASTTWPTFDEPGDPRRQLNNCFRFNYSLAFSRALSRPSATACAYMTWQEWRMILADSRALWISNPFCRAIERNLITYGVGDGHVYSVQGRDGEKPDKALKRKVLKRINDFRRANHYLSRQKGKLVRRARDGEFALRKFRNHPDGILRVRFVEPLLIQNPPGVGEEGGVFFGIKFDGDNYEEPVGYYVRPANYQGGDNTKSHVEQVGRLHLPPFGLRSHHSFPQSFSHSPSSSVPNMR